MAQVRGRLLPAKSNDFYWQRHACTEDRDTLLGRSHEDVVEAGRRHQILAQKRATSSLDGVECGIEFVDAIETKIELIVLIQRRQRNSQLPSQRFGVERC